MNQSRRDLPLNALRAFEVAARAASFTAAAESLNIAQSAVSRHIRRLEGIVGQRLFVRSASGARLTEVGERLLPSVMRSFEGMSNALEEIGSSHRLRLHLPPGFVQAIGLPLVRRFKSIHPDIGLSILSSYGIGPPSADYDVAVVFDRSDRLTDGRTLLWEIAMTPVCSVVDVDRLAALGLETAIHSEDLLHVQMDGYPADHLWTGFAAQVGVDAIKPAGLAFGTVTLAIDFARAGVGLALADLRGLQTEVTQGTLALPFNTSTKPGFSYYLPVADRARQRRAAMLLAQHIHDAADVRPNSRRVPNIRI